MNIYVITTIVSVIETIILLIDHNKIKSQHLLFFIFGILASFGYSIMSVNSNLEVMLLGNCIYYIGGLTCSIFMIYTVADICQIKLSRWIAIIYSILEMVILYFVFNVQSSDLYYRSLKVSYAYGVYFLEKTRGPIYLLTAAVLLSCNIVVLSMIPFSLKNRSTSSTRTAAILLLMEFVTTVFYFIPRLCNIHLDITVVAYVVDMGFFLILFSRSSLYDMTDNLLRVYNERGEYGYICFDAKKRFMGCTNTLLHPVPQLRLQKIDSRIDTSLFVKDMPKQVTEWIESYIDYPDGVPIERQFEQDGKYWDATIHEIGRFRFNKGYFIEFRDDTRDMQYIREAEHAREIAEEAMEKDRLMRHDRRHFEGMILTLLQDNKTEEAKKLLEERLKVEPRRIQRFCENKAINATIGHYVSMANKNNINMKIELNIPESIDTDHMELSIAIGNLLENAIIACSKLDEEKRYITFIARYKNQLLIEIENSCNGEVIFDDRGYPITENYGHGVGTKSVIYFIHKTESEIFYSLTDNIFKVRLIVN